MRIQLEKPLKTPKTTSTRASDPVLIVFTKDLFQETFFKTCTRASDPDFNCF